MIEQKEENISEDILSRLELIDELLDKLFAKELEDGKK